MCVRWCVHVNVFLHAMNFGPLEMLAPWHLKEKIILNSYRKNRAEEGRGYKGL
jgi:hypothetical protein